VNDRPREHGLSPVEALERLRAVLSDARLTPAERIAASAVVLAANRSTGLAWPSFRTIAREFHLSPKVIASALAASSGKIGPDGKPLPGGLAVGVHVELDGRGPHGARLYRVLPVQDDAASASYGEAPKEPERFPLGSQALPFGQPGASLSAVKRFPSQSGPDVQREAENIEPGASSAVVSARTTSEELAHKTCEGNCPPPSARSDTKNGDALDANGRLLTILGRANGRPPTNGTAEKFLQAVREARAGGATDAEIAHHVLEVGPGAAPWAGANAAREAARALLADFGRLDVRPPRKTVADILRFIDFSREKLAEPGAAGEAAATWRRVADWAASHADALRRAATWPAGRGPHGVRVKPADSGSEHEHLPQDSDVHSETSVVSAAKARQAAAATAEQTLQPPVEPPSPRLADLAGRVAVGQVLRHVNGRQQARIVRAGPEGIEIESRWSLSPFPVKICLRTEYELSRWTFEPAESVAAPAPVGAEGGSR